MTRDSGNAASGEAEKVSTHLFFTKKTCFENDEEMEKIGAHN